MAESKLKTIKVTKKAILNLNAISGLTCERQYEVVERLSEIELKKVIKRRK